MEEGGRRKGGKERGRREEGAGREGGRRRDSKRVLRYRRECLFITYHSNHLSPPRFLTRAVLRISKTMAGGAVERSTPDASLPRTMVFAALLMP